MGLPIIDHYERWKCGTAELVLGVREGIVLFARCDCPRTNREADLYIDYPTDSDIWSYETSYCVHTYTVLAHYYARHANAELNAERIDDDLDDV